MELYTSIRATESSKSLGRSGKITQIFRILSHFVPILMSPEMTQGAVGVLQYLTSVFLEAWRWIMVGC